MNQSLVQVKDENFLRLRLGRQYNSDIGLFFFDFFDKFCKFSLIDIHLFCLCRISGQCLVDSIKTVKIGKPRIVVRDLRLVCILFDKFEFLGSDLIFVVSTGLFFFSQLENVTK